jgi:hypothetical protein
MKIEKRSPSVTPDGHLFRFNSKDIKSPNAASPVKLNEKILKAQSCRKH